MTELTALQFDNETIKNYLPHRYPFLLVDRVVELEAGKSIKAYKNVTCNEPFFNGHFPQKSIMPGVLQIEALAQTAGLLIVHQAQQDTQERSLFYFAGIDAARFKRLVVPGDKLTLEATVQKARRDLWKFNVLATVEGETACEAEIMLIKDNEK